MTEAVATAPIVATPQRNRLGIVALVLVLIAIAAPIVTFLVVVIGASASGAQGDDVGWAVLGAWFFSFGVASAAGPVALAGVVLAVIALLRPGLRKVQGVLALILGVVPAFLTLFLPATIDTLF